MDDADKCSNLFILIQVVRLTSAEFMMTIPNREAAIFLPHTEVSLCAAVAETHPGEEQRRNQ